jgi:hypothetical protein
MLLTLIVVVLAGNSAAQAAPAVAAATPVSLFKESAQLLIPAADPNVYGELTGKSGTAQTATASYFRRTALPAALSINIRVFKTEAAAQARYISACSGCRPGTAGPQKWRYKIQYQDQPGADDSVTLSALCRNVTVAVGYVAPLGNTSLHHNAKKAIWAVYDKAVSLGMTQCGSTPKPPPVTGSYYWSERQAEELVVRKVRIPDCNISISSKQGCERDPAWRLHSAECRGLDEKPGTFTYSRFTCDVLIGYYGDIRGRLAVWPTGPTTLRWEIM